MEVEALESMWNGDWKAASEKFHLAASVLTSYPAARGYQATLLFRSAVAMEKASRDAHDHDMAATADALATQAVDAAKPATWMAALLPFEGRQAQAPERQLLSAAVRLSTYIDEVGSPVKLKAKVETMMEGLSADRVQGL